MMYAQKCTAQDYYYNPVNVTRTTISQIAKYRSALTLDWLAAEDTRQRELAAAFETEAAPPSRVLATECIAYARPSAGKVARLMLELLKNLEGDNAKLIPDLVQVLLRAKILVETSSLDVEPNLEALVKTPGVMLGEPHVTFPRIIAVLWLIVTDTSTTRKNGWCPINRINKYIAVSKSSHIAKQMRALDPIIARARFIMEEFIQNVTPLNMQKTTAEPKSPRMRAHTRAALGRRPKIRYYTTVNTAAEESMTSSAQDLLFDRIIDGSAVVVQNAAVRTGLCELVFILALFFLQ